MDLSSIVSRILVLTEEQDSDLVPLVSSARVERVSSRPLDASTGKRLGVSLRLLLAPRELGRVLASPSLQDRLTTVTATAVGDDATDELLLDLSFGCAPVAGLAHPYRAPPSSSTGLDGGGASVGSRRAFPAGDERVAEAVRALVAGYFSELSDPPFVEVSVYADEVVLAVDAAPMIFNQLAPKLRDAALKITRKVLVHRQRR